MSEAPRRPISLSFVTGETPGDAEPSLPPAWREFIRYCREMRHGEIERLSIQDGLPVLAEITTKKVKFNR